jgi:hypothetical protein
MDEVSISRLDKRSINVSDIKVNKLIWDSISKSDKESIVIHLQQYGVLKPGQNIIADTHTPLPFIKSHTKEDVMMKDEEGSINALGVDWICRAICDSTNAEADCPLYGQPLEACLATISAGRESGQTDC